MSEQRIDCPECRLDAPYQNNLMHVDGCPCKSSAPVERPELPAMDYSMSAHEQCDERERQLLGVKAELLSAQSRIRELESRVDGIDRLDNRHPVTHCLQLLSDFNISTGKACEFIRKYLLTGVQDPIADEAQPYHSMLDETSASEMANRLEKAEAERDQLKAKVEELTKNRDQWERNSAAENSRAGDALVAMRRLKADILAITETPEWFDSPGAREVRKVLEGKDA